MPKHTHPIKDGREIAEAMAVVGDQGGIVHVPAGTYEGDIEWPNLPNVTLRGEGYDATTLEGGIRFPGGVRISNWRIEDLSVHGQGEGIGIHILDGDRGEIKRVRCYVWDTCIKIESTIDLGALHNDVLRCRVTNANEIGVHLAGAQGPHQCHIHGGEISISKGVGLQVDGPCDNTEVLGTSFESNAQAMQISGVRGHYIGYRLEGNEKDVLCTEESGYNTFQTGFFDPEKHEDYSKAHSNRVLPYGQWTSDTENKHYHYIPADPMAITMAPLTPGKRVAISHLFQIYELYRLESLAYVPCRSGGKVDIAVCSTDGKVIRSTGPTAVGEAGQRQEIALSRPVNLTPARWYFAVIAFDSAEGGCYGAQAHNAGFQLGQGEPLARAKTLSNWPIGDQDCISGGSGTMLAPAFSLG